MKNQYLGDVYDYIKYGLLRQLNCRGRVSAVVCWMLTENDDRRDGNRVNYLKEPEAWRAFDPPVFDRLRQQVPDGQRGLRRLCNGCVGHQIIVAVECRGNQAQLVQIQSQVQRPCQLGAKLCRLKRFIQPLVSGLLEAQVRLDWVKHLEAWRQARLQWQLTQQRLREAVQRLDRRYVHLRHGPPAPVA